MNSEKIVISFVYQENNHFILIVPDITNKPIAKAKSQIEVIRKSINILRKDYQEKIIELPSNDIDMLEKKYDVPKSYILFPLPIKVGKRVKKFKRFSSSMNGEILEKIEKYTTNKKMKKSDFFTLASLEYIENHP
jgi:hypothetical protein